MRKKFLIGVAVGSGLAARSAAHGGADFLLALNVGRFRTMGAPSAAGTLPIRGATELTDSFAAKEVLHQSDIPVFLGFNTFDETCEPEEIAAKAKEEGFDGLVNFPSSLHYPASLQRILERAGRGVAAEVAVLAAARAQGLQTLYYCANRTQARLGADAKLDMILLYFGWNSGGTAGHQSRETLEEVALRAHEIGRFLRRLHPTVKIFVEGGPIVTAADLAKVAVRSDLDGYIGGSTIERLPLENAVGDLIASYRSAGQPAVRTGQTKLSWARRFGAVGDSPALAQLAEDLFPFSQARAPVLIRHESGADLRWPLRVFEENAGKAGIQILRPGSEERHGAAGRRIFGVAAQGAEDRAGALGRADCGLLIIHEPQELSPRIQTRLAHALSEGRFTVPGSRQRQRVLAQSVFTSAAWSGDEPPAGLVPELAELLAQRCIDMPPLRLRGEDLSSLIEARFDELSLPRAHRPKLSPAALHELQTQDWPNNEAGLYALIDRLMRSGTEIKKDHIQRIMGEGKRIDTAAGDKSERSQIVEALWRHRYHKGDTARALGISRKTLYNKIKRYGLSG